ncbi:MAG TPA: hypothetical protein VN442_23460 [Bryobacteraceae bacterium]|nr:hypothetical protein [Bryobacteraceae bacterium]
MSGSVQATPIKVLLSETKLAMYGGFATRMRGSCLYGRGPARGQKGEERNQ